MYSICVCTTFSNWSLGSRARHTQNNAVLRPGLGSISTCVTVVDWQPPAIPASQFSFSSLCSLIYLAKVPNDLIELHSYRSGRRPTFCGLPTLHSEPIHRVTLKYTKRQEGGFNIGIIRGVGERFAVDRWKQNKELDSKIAMLQLHGGRDVLYHYGSGYQWVVYRMD